MGIYVILSRAKDLSGTEILRPAASDRQSWVVNAGYDFLLHVCHIQYRFLHWREITSPALAA